MIPSRNIILLLPLMLLLSVVTPPGALALKCWQGPLMNRLDVTKQVPSAAQGSPPASTGRHRHVGWYTGPRQVLPRAAPPRALDQKDEWA